MNRVVLFEPEKPGNVGNIIRTCKAFDCKLTIIGDLTFSLDDKAFRRAEMDYCIGFNIERIKTIDEFFNTHKDETGYFVTRYSSNIYSDFDLSSIDRDMYFMFGKESTGIPKSVLKANIKRTMRIPMAIDSRSLNLSNSVAIIISEALRQQSFFNMATAETIKGKNFLDQF